MKKLHIIVGLLLFLQFLAVVEFSFLPLGMEFNTYLLARIIAGSPLFGVALPWFIFVILNWIVFLASSISAFFKKKLFIRSVLALNCLNIVFCLFMWFFGLTKVEWVSYLAKIIVSSLMAFVLFFYLKKYHKLDLEKSVIRVLKCKGE